MEQHDSASGERRTEQLHEHEHPTEPGAMPARVSVSARAAVMVLLVLLVLLVNQ